MKKLFAIGMTLILGVGLTLNAYAAGDATKGKAAYAVCAACHGANGMGNKALNAPRIAGQEPWYLERQLNNYKKGSVFLLFESSYVCRDIINSLIIG